jgi:hypothetical protein
LPDEPGFAGQGLKQSVAKFFVANLRRGFDQYFVCAGNNSIPEYAS